MAKKTLSDLFKRWVNQGRRVTSDSSRYRTRLRLEEVEQRLAPATLPLPTASDTRTIGAGFAPQAVADPNNPNTIIVVSANPNIVGVNNVGFGVALVGQISIDGGQTWGGFTITNPDTGQNSGPGGAQLTKVNSPSIAMSRTGELYVAWTSTTSDFTTAGRLRVSTFTVAGNSVTPLNGPVTIYEWLGQDPIFNPTIAVDNNVDQFTDPDTLAMTPQDTLLGANGKGKAVYVAWNTAAGTPTVTSSHSNIPPSQLVFIPNVIFAAASRDQGKTFSTPVPVSDGGFVVFPPQPGQPLIGGVAPHILFTPGDLNPNTNDSPGRLQFVWSVPGGTVTLGGSTFIVGGTSQDISQPDGGVLAQEATTVLQVNGPGVVISEPGIPADNTFPDSPVNSDSPIVVNIDPAANGNAPFFDKLSDLDVTLAITHPHTNQLRIFLIPPAATTLATGVGAIQLLESRIDGLGVVRPNPGGSLFGLPDQANIGVGTLAGFNVPTGTVFDAEAARLIFDPANAAPYIAHFRPESFGGSNLSALYGTPAANLNGTWRLRIIDVRDDDRNAGFTPNLPIPFLNFWSMKMSSLISNTGFGVDSAITSPSIFGSVGGTPNVTSTNANLGGTAGSNATALGFGAGLALAYDTSLGSFSPFSGALYVAYTSNNGNIFVNRSDDNGTNWKGAVRVNDDSASDNFSEGNRSQFMPSLAVDPVTGTVVVSWYDARNDASNARVTTYISTSIDGGRTFSAQGLNGFLNTTKDAVDQLTRTTVQLEPVPTNLRAAGVANGGSEAGIRQSLLAYGGQIKPFWTGNENGNVSGVLTATDVSGVFTATVITAGGPRIIDNNPSLNSDQGAVTADAPGGYNKTFTLDGTRQINGFTVTFDRVIDVSTFTPADVTVLFRAPTTQRDATIPPTLIPVNAVTPLNPVTTQAGFPANATRFFVSFTTPQSAVGTYSYAILPDISDRIRSKKLSTFTPPNTPTPIPDLMTTDSTLSVPSGLLDPLGTPAIVLRMRVNVDITHTFDGDLKLTLFAPNGTSIVLSNRNGGGGNNYTGTIFDDFAATAIDTGSAPFTGSFKPQTGNALSTFNGLSVSGAWSLRVEDLAGGDVGTLNGWSITFLDVLGNPIVYTQSRTFMDQDADSLTREIGNAFNPNIPVNQQAPRLFTDAFTAPRTIGADPFNSDPFALSFDSNTLPLIETGPHLVDTSSPSNPLATDNLVFNGTANAIDLTFDRDIDPTSFTPANILRMTGPTGAVHEQQILTVLGTQGTFRVSFNAGTGNQTTLDLPFNVPASGGMNADSSLQNALGSLTNIGVGNVTVTSTNVSGGRAYRITFTGVLGNANQPTITAVGTGGATISALNGIVTERFTITQTGTRSFRVGFPTQQLSGSYNIEFGPNLALPTSNPLYSIRSVNVPQLVAVVAAANQNSLTVTFDNTFTGPFVASDILRVTGPTGNVSLAGVTTQLVSGNTYRIVFPATLPKGQYVVDFDPSLTRHPVNSGSAIDSNFNAGLDVLRGQDPSASTFASNVFLSTGSAVINPATPDGQGGFQSTATDLSINIADDFIISNDSLNNIQLLMNIAHPNVRDLDIDLIPPVTTGVASIRLFSGSLLGGTQANQTANFTNTRFLDRVNDPNVPSIEAAAPPFNSGANNFFSPQTPLSVLLGKSSRGVWTLRVTNHGTNPSTADPNFNTNAPIQIINWSLTLPHSVPGTGLGESVADRFQAGFRIFTQDPTNSLTRQVWTGVGPAPTNEGANSARISTIAVDPSDPTGNTVYVAAAGGGVWKTTDFLTSNTNFQNTSLVPSGPHYVPLTDFGLTNAIDITSIALFPRNNDPAQTIVFALTGESNTLNHFPGQYTAAGVGVIRSLDGGNTWQVLDSTNNVDATGKVVLMSDSSTRNHLFVGATGYKIVVDPTPGKDGGVIVYMALSGNANQNGVWRSLDGGNKWARIQAGNATDVVLSAGSANTNDPVTGATVFQGNLQQLYAGFSSVPAAIITGPGVYKTDSAPAAASLDLLAGGINNPLLRDFSIPGTPQITTALPGSNPNVFQRISLAVPALTGNPVEDSFLRDWLYAMTTDGNGAAQLYVTKDAGAHWTLVRVPNLPTLPDPTDPSQGGGTNNESTEQPIFPPVNGVAFVGRAQVDVRTQNDYDMAITVDPQNPNIVYLAGAGTRSIRLDLTKVRDAHNFTFYNNSDAVLNANKANPAFTTQINGNRSTIGGLQPQIFQPANVPVRGAVFIGGSPFFTYVDDKGVSTGFLNLLRDFNQPFTTNSLIRVRGTSDSAGGPAGFYVNDGADISWSPFSDILDPNVPDQTGSFRTEHRFEGVNIHSIIPITDPITHKTRLYFGTDDGVFTGVDSRSTIGTGTISPGIGFSQAVRGNRNGNLQISQFYSGAVQPSQLAADLAGALFYGMGDESGFPVSTASILSTGDLNYRGPTGDGVAVLVDQAGSGTAFQYRSPNTPGFDLNSTATSLDFFRVLTNTSEQAFGGGFSRTGGASGSLFDNGDFWPNTTASGFPTPIPQPTVNPQNPNVLMIGSLGGRIYRTTDQGKTWVTKAQPSQLDGFPIVSVAFGASDPALPTLTNNFLYAGSTGGRIFSSTTGGAPWTQIGSGPLGGLGGNGLDGSSILRIVANPKVGTKDVFALTTTGVFYKADGTLAAGNWVNITGNLFALTRSNFGNVADTNLALTAGGLTALAIDWRFAFPFPADPTHTFPILYVGGNGGVFRTVDFGVNWTFFPDVTNDGAPVEGGYLPNTHITDLDLSIGDLDPASGKYKAGGLNMLVATTYGRGTFAIRLSDTSSSSTFISGPRVIQLINPNPIGGPSTILDVKFGSQVDPTTFTATDVSLIGPNGPIAVTSVTMTSVPDATGVNPRNLFRITFPQQTALGSYSIVIGANPFGGDIPQISDPSGFLMNQDNDLINGEALVDQYRNTIQLNSTTNNHLFVSVFPSSLTAGVAGSVTIEARDGSDVVLGSVNGPLTLTSAPGTGTFTTSPTTVTLVNGVATFNVTYFSTGAQTVNVTFAGPPTINGTAWTTNVNAAAASQFAFTPAAVILTAPATQVFTLTAQDAFGNTTTTYNQTATLAVTGAAATVPDTVDLVNGTASFTGTFNASGTVQITATGPNPTATGNITGTANVTVNPGPATHLGFTISATTLSVGDTASVAVQALDSQGNLANNLNGTPLTVGVSPSGTSTVNPVSPIFVNGVANFTVRFTAAGTFNITGTSAPLSVTIGPITIGTAPPPPSPTQNLTNLFAVGSGVDGSPLVTVFNGANGSPRTSFIPFPPGFHNEVDPTSGGFTGGERVSVADVTGDGVPDYVVGTGPSITAAVVIYDGVTKQEIFRYFPFEGFQGGVFVSTGDINKDGINDIAITPDEGGGPRVVVLSKVNGAFTRIANFFGINDPGFRGGARSAIGDLNGDGFAELVVSAGFGGGPRISVFDGAALAQGREAHPIGDFFLFNPALRNGAYLAVGDVNGDGFADIIGGAGPGGGPQVFIISGKTLLEQGPEIAVSNPISNFFAGNPDNRGGIRVAAKNLDNDRKADVVTGAGDGGGSTVSVYLGASLTAGNLNPLYQFDAFPGYLGGVFVG